jgi:hypothetical protein
VELENEEDEIYDTFGDLHTLDLNSFTWECLDKKLRGDIPCARRYFKNISILKC